MYIESTNISALESWGAIRRLRHDTRSNKLALLRWDGYKVAFYFALSVSPYHDRPSFVIHLNGSPAFRKVLP